MGFGDPPSPLVIQNQKLEYPACQKDQKQLTPPPPLVRHHMLLNFNLLYNIYLSGRKFSFGKSLKLRKNKLQKSWRMMLHFKVKIFLCLSVDVNP